PKAQQEIATARVRRGDVIVRSYARGELRATRSVTLTAPNLFGTVQVTRLAPLGSFAHEKDLIVEFDDSEVNSRLEEKQLELEQKNKGLFEMQREKSRLSQVKLLSPMTGLVAIKQNRPNFFFPGMQIPDIREGDQLNPGIAVADVLDLSELEVLARVGELDRANLREGQDVMIQLDAIPGKTINGKIKNMSGSATSNVFSSDPAKKFDVIFSLDMKQLFATLGVKPEKIQQI